jgi:hypothetical protein
MWKYIVFHGKLRKIKKKMFSQLTFVAKVIHYLGVKKIFLHSIDFMGTKIRRILRKF